MRTAMWRDTFVDNGSGKCAAVPNSTSANGVQLIQWTCNDSYGQGWDR